MAIYRIFADKDTTITSYRRLNVAQTASNLGGSEVLQIFRVAPVSSSATYVSGSLARALIRFNHAHVASLTASGEAPSTGISYFLHMKDAKHFKTLPASYDVEVERLARDWDEGKGIDFESFFDKGYANWDKARSNVFWTTPGGDVTGSLISKQHFDIGDEDLDVDVTSLVNSWMTGNIPNYGFLVHMSSTLESGSVDYFTKMFHSRQTHYPDFRPYLEARWDDSVKDDRNNFVYGVTGTLYLYNVVRGQLTNISGIGTGQNVLTVKVVDASGTIKTVSGSHTGLTGIYSASFALVSSSYSGSTFSDVWYSGSVAYMTCSFTPTGDFSRCVNRPGRYVVNITNLKDYYETTEKARMQVFVRGIDYNPAVVLTASSPDPNGLVITKGYYRIVNDRTGEVIVPFGTGSVETTRMSYDSKGNYFDLYMSSLPEQQVYRVSLLFDVGGTKQIVDPGFRFRVRSVG